MDLLYSNDKPVEYPASYYHATAPTLPRFPSLQQDARYDVCVVGGGYTGLSSALHLAQKGLNVVLLEAHRVGWGASGRNGGQVGSGFSTDQKQLEQLVGITPARALWDIAEDAKSTVKQLIATHNIDCDWKNGVLATSWKARNCRHYAEDADYLAKHYNYDQLSALSGSDVAELLGTPVYACGVLDRDAGQLHPLKYAIGLTGACAAAGVTLHEGTLVNDINEESNVRITTDKATVTADKLVLACNGYLGKILPAISQRVMPINNFIVATVPLDGVTPDILPGDLAVCDSKFVVNYFRRSPDNRLLFGGGENYGYRFPADIQKTVSKPMLQIYPQLKHTAIEFAWGGTLAITSNRMPHFEQVSHSIVSASGYSGHGVAMATMAGKVISEFITGNPTRFELLASVPKARFPGGAAFRSPMLALAMTWYALLDKLP